MEASSQGVRGFSSRLWYLVLAALPLIVAACGNGGGSGY